jgi:cytochrome c-type biogenesis protein
MPEIARLDGEYGSRGLQVLGVSIDGPGAAADIDRFARRHGMRFTILLDPAQRVSQAFRTVGVPETFLIDRRGRIAHRWIGAFQPLGDDVRMLIERVLAD